MSIVRGPRPETGWYALDKRISEDERLGWAARGLLVFLLGKPDHWEISIEHLKRQTASARIHSGRDALYGMIAELEAAGYLERNQPNDAGRFGATRYIVREIPAPVYKGQAALPLPDNPDTDEPCTDEPHPANPPLAKNDISAKTDSEQSRAQRATTRKPTAAIALPSWVPADAWAGWLEMRDKARKSPTDRAQGLALRELESLRAAGHDPQRVIDQSTRNNWLDFYAIKPEKGNAATHPTRGRPSLAERVRANEQRTHAAAAGAAHGDALAEDDGHLRAPLDGSARRIG